MRRMQVTLGLVVLALVLWALPAAAERLVLRDGSSVNGTLDKLTATEIHVVTQYGALRIPIRDVDRIVFQESARVPDRFVGLVLRDGSLVPGEVTTWTGSSFGIRQANGRTLYYGREQVAIVVLPEFREVSGRPFLGVEYIEVESWEMPPGISSARPVKVLNVLPGTAAERHGLRRGDIIAYVNDAAVRGQSHFGELISQQKPGATVYLLIYRDREYRVIAVVLGGQREASVTGF